jgi:hypothetical protein
MHHSPKKNCIFTTILNLGNVWADNHLPLFSMHHFFGDSLRASLLFGPAKAKVLRETQAFFMPSRPLAFSECGVTLA